ncbi:Respiratory nitrate reductase alpha chain [Thioalkalivibrio nitratireducens DSM 14787]|uniref:Respiratory nitrate reductase alpha chain n=1 Tax=Thioalkalivibrio nitratireducens (strain DSM 14787 / UNIQEM 213 / ALEN2) TaxID=1255043 RepID=L0DUV1_THIND|nr:molybdopterin-dependent oxidoreductase [Thioalkalivibrio nitratireducens]AGA32798.1 Respiratory nitrate reductase alpha chain [Thioalkalivibrio nitratireducens DSM 14787]
MGDRSKEFSKSRRHFLQLAGAAGFGAVATPGAVLAQFRYLAPTRVENPLAHYPDRNWEHIYRDIYRSDGSFVFTCAPNDTHNCLLRAFYKNKVLTRIEPTYGYHKATDLEGNQASARWDPRCCQKGLVLTRRLYGDRRVKGAFLRKGFKDWVDEGFPRDATTGMPPKHFLNRGWDSWVKVSHEEAADYHARTLRSIAETYSGEQGRRHLEAQGYHPSMIDAMDGAGTRTMKVRGGMAKLGAARLLGTFRMGNSLALLDHHVRGVGPDEAKGAGAWDSYSFHTDLPPGHTMVCGDQTNDFEFHDADNAEMIVVWGMNWICTKMPDSHWLTEARLKGAKTVAVTVEYSATANKCDEVLVIRPGTDPALALGMAGVIIREGIYDKDFVRRYTDLPALVRMDTLEGLKARDVFPGHVERQLDNWTHVLGAGEEEPPVHQQNGRYIPHALKGEFSDFVVWDKATGEPVAVGTDQLGDHFDKLGIDPALEGSFRVRTVDGKTVEVRPVFDLTRQYIDDNLTPEQVEAITWAPRGSVESVARDIAKHAGKTLVPCGMGPNQFWNNDNKDRAIFLLVALTGNVGRHGGNIGSYAGNYRVSLFSGAGLWTGEDPFNVQIDPEGPVSRRSTLRYESLHYWANGERIMMAGDKVITTGNHVPTPTKAIWQTNSNSSLGNQKGHYDVVNNTLPKCELVVYNDWWWTASCEYSDIVYGVDSWMEFKHPDMTASNTNPFLQIFPATPLRRTYGTVHDLETYLLVSRALSDLTGDRRFVDLWRFVEENRVDVYLQRILDHSANLRGYQFHHLNGLARAGIPALVNNRTYPRVFSYEQVAESKPWYTKTGRLEFYRPEPEFIEAGENLAVYREPSEATFHEPCAILAKEHPAIRPKRPADWGIPADDRSHQNRQMRNTTMDGASLLASKHPLIEAGYRYVFHTPKYRHGAHTTPIDTDYMMMLFGPFGDIYRRDKRMPGTSEMYVDINPSDAKELGIADGDYVWIDGDPEELPFRGWQQEGREDAYKVARLMARARYYPGTPPGITRMWFNGYMATPGSVQGHEGREDGIAKSPETNYQAMFRYGGHQSLTRSWLKPTHQTNSLVWRRLFSHVQGQGFAADVHCVTGAPRESMAKFTKAEPGGIGGEGLWRPVSLGLRPAAESEALQRYLKGAYVLASDKEQS